ncbi:MAG: pantoate--beta-alanine ligase [bacterium]|nr:pantoate--beta-alanine ligase [bacterium]
MNVKVFRTIEELRARLANVRRKVTIGCVPTMGALHAGHGALIDRARQECDFVIVTLFVNPIQFNLAADFNSYPRTFDDDTAFCEARGVDIIFAPADAEIYPEPTETFVEVPLLTNQLCGAHRPGHFRGVTTVVTKLFNIIQPNRAYFGEKDAQQLATIRRMVRDLNISITIVGVPTVREPDGLAVSSRNRLLTSAERARATILYKALEAAREAIEAGESDPAKVKAAAAAVYATEPEVQVEYLEIVEDDTMQPVTQIKSQVRIATAASFGETRLIDNVIAGP